MANGKHQDISFAIDDKRFKHLINRIKKVEKSAQKRREILSILKKQLKPIETAVAANTPVRGLERTEKVPFKFGADKNSGLGIANQYNLRFKGSQGVRVSMVTKKRKFPRGNLKRSIGTMKVKDKVNVNARVAPRSGKKKKVHDGFYGWWHIYGWTPFVKDGKSKYGKRVPANDFIWKAAAPLLRGSATAMTKELKKFIKRKYKIT